MWYVAKICVWMVKSCSGYRRCAWSDGGIWAIGTNSFG